MMVSHSVIIFRTEKEYIIGKLQAKESTYDK